ncbi:conserved hypothetical protein [Ricinus communis]|uniref:Secreted protein n=1 Tax=Ricinus communis TaxID=3988 RepID=B9SWI1_RICCO|nr:conserved hypothetical protein [Ricinus communis]
MAVELQWVMIVIGVKLVTADGKATRIIVVSSSTTVTATIVAAPTASKQGDNTAAGAVGIDVDATSTGEPGIVW